MTVALTRVRPLKHFGHRMLADLPALFMLRKFFLDQGLDVAHIKVMFTGDPGATLCFQQLVLMPVTFYSKWFNSGQGPDLNMWGAPEMLFDMDAVHLDMVGHIRASLGLESNLPFAPTGNQTRIVVASRDAAARKRHGHRQQRLLLNEGDLVKALSGLPGVQVEQIEFTSLTMPEVVRLLNTTSLFVGYHGAAFDNCVFLPRGAYILEILPQGTTHAPLYPTLAHRTGKEFVRYVNTNVTRQSCQRVDKDGKDYQQEKCLDHVADLMIDVGAVLSLVKSVLQVQSSALTLHEFDNYRTVAKSSLVDESLFGSSKTTASCTDDKSISSPANSRGKFYEPALVNHTQKQQEAVKLHEADLQRMLTTANVTTAQQVQTFKQAAEERMDLDRAAAKARKERMLRLKYETELQAPATECDKIKTAADHATLSHAGQLLQEEKDEVKHMNKMVQYAKCMSVRDKQVQEKREMMLAEESEEKHKDLMMEIERVRAVEAYQARDVQRREEQARSAAILREQLAERERQRLRELEQRDQERQQMVAELARLQEEETAAARAKRQRASALMQEVAGANAEQIRRKRLLAQQELEEEARIAQYIVQKDAREQALAAEAASVAHARELEVARLRSMQEKQADHQSEQDETRARRYQEAKEREWRAKERAAAERQATMMADLAAAREHQMRAKLVAQSQMAAVEQEEFKRVLQVNQEKAAQEHSQAITQQTIAEAYKKDLLGQIQAREETNRAERLSYLEEGKKLRQVQQHEKALLEQVKQQKLEELAAGGVPEKYCAELARLNIRSAK
eukprot:gene6096-6333_t